MPKEPYHLTPEQLALSEARKAQKLHAQKKPPQVPVTLIPRIWMESSLTKASQNDENDELRVKVMTWNMLAQCLVRRDLFPGSDCLKASQRDPLLHAELLMHGADIMCLQEVDRVELLLPVLEGAGYRAHHAAAPSKKHGCLIAYKHECFTKTFEKVIYYDNEQLHADGEDNYRRGSSFRTRNIGFAAVLRSTSSDSLGVVVVTTHLFWHPRYTYERARQTYILIREVLKFRSENGLNDWPCIFAGDFNFPPNDIVYSLLFRDPIESQQKEDFSSSMVVHLSIDPTVPRTLQPSTDGEEGGDPDRIITSARPALPKDGLLGVGELEGLFKNLPRLCSVYDEGLGRCLTNHPEVKTFGQRKELPSERHGRHEPEYSSYTHYWQSTIDYIYVLNPADVDSEVTKLLMPHKGADMAPGLPRSGICGSDHVALGAELLWRRNKR
ncbi:Endonuclease/exonuclease/phosphatase [Pluteus cervinus]|uniref:Endonuclease/exonuclease/phosphatase n=1 Tax=Pluteus cervinus TaxID=181527 RepID=A0ACD3BHH3_9AGAR|nr:Endonuclease/exonuclease/phosphatase [Pluteus cervinus]